MIRIDITLGDHFFTDVFFQCFIDDFVIHISKVADIGDMIAFRFKQTLQDIKDNHRSGISDMRIVIDGRSAYIHANLTVFNRFEFLNRKCF